MTVSVDDVMKKFTPEQRAHVEARAAELIEEELTLREGTTECTVASGLTEDVSNSVQDAAMDASISADGMLALSEDIADGHREYLANPSEGVPADEILGRIQVRSRARGNGNAAQE